MLRAERYTCIKCRKSFTKMVGGVIASPMEHELSIRPICDRCKLDKVVDILNLRK